MGAEILAGAAGGASMWPVAGAMMGGNVLSQLFGSGGPPKEWYELFRLFKGRLGKDLISDQDVNSLLPSMNAGLAPYQNKLADQASRRVGLDSGAGQAYMMREGQAGLQQLFGNAKLGQMNTNANAEQQLWQLMAGMVN